MLFGLKIDGDKKLVDDLVEEWNEIFKEPVRNIISETRYYKDTSKLKLPENTYVMSIKPILPMFMWFSILILGAVGSAIFGFWKVSIVLLTIFLVMSLFFIPPLYVWGTKHRLKKNGYNGKVKYVSSSEILRIMLESSED
jgi:hypothetical protein